MNRDVLPASIRTLLRYLESLIFLVIQTFYWVGWGIAKRKKQAFLDALKQMEIGGVRSFPIVALVSFFFGLTLAMLTSYQLRKVGSEIMVGGLVKLKQKFPQFSM